LRNKQLTNVFFAIIKHKTNKQGVMHMKKSLIISRLIALSLVFLLILVCGCTKRSIVRDYPPVKEKTAAKEVKQQKEVL
jgi:hypothetical protein